MDAPSAEILPLDGVTAWLADQGLSDLSLAETVQQLGRHLVASGIALHRLAAGGMILHPVFGARDVVWIAKTDHVTSEMMPRTIIQTPDFQNSPFFHALKQGARFTRYRLSDGDSTPDFPIFGMLRKQGVTDYLVFYRDYGRRDLELWQGLPQGMEGALASFSTCRLSGFSQREVEYLQRLSSVLALVVKTKTSKELAMTLLDTYLGSYSGGHVLNGLVERRDGREIECVIWTSDLRGSSALAEKLDLQHYLAFLDSYFDCTAGSVLDHGGEVLKFIGDAVMAIFPVDAELRPVEDMCRSALESTREALARAALRNDAKAQDHPDLKFGVSMHLGKVVYGNVGTDRRLDLTVVGAAVNQASRLESLTKTLGVPVLASKPFAGASPEALVSLGHHEVPGMPQKLETFTLPEFAGAT